MTWRRIFSFHKWTLREKPSLEDPEEESICSMHELPGLFGKKRIIKQGKVSKTHPPTNLDLANSNHLIQWIFLL